jgi:hypothetical protein
MKLLFVGDVMLGRLVNKALKARPGPAEQRLMLSGGKTDRPMDGFRRYELYRSFLRSSGR